MTWHYHEPPHLDEHLDADRQFADWMGKSGGNAFFFIRHPFDSELTIPQLLPEFRKRGIELEYGGHVIPLLLPREEFAAHPDYFPILGGGERSDCGNACPSNRAMLAVLGRNAVELVARHPELSVLHIWGADLWEGGWCRCTDCAGLTPQDQSLTVCNAVWRALAEAGSPRPVCYLAYHDTLDANLSVRPEAGVWIEFAPRERCYGHAIDEATCATNATYRGALEAYAERFDGRVRLFEYYGDAILFCGCAVPLTEVIEADLNYAQRTGIRDITFLQFGRYCEWAYPLNFVAFAAATRDGCCAAATKSYLDRFDAAAGVMGDVFQRMEKAMQHVVTYGDIRNPPRDPAVATALHHRLTTAALELRAIESSLERHASSRVAAQDPLVRYTRTVLEGVVSELTDRSERGRARAVLLFDEAQDILTQISTHTKGVWGALDLPTLHAYHSAGGFAAAR